MFRCAYSRNDAVEAQGSNVGSVFSGVNVGAGRSCLAGGGGNSCPVGADAFEVDDRDLCLGGCPVDMLRHTARSMLLAEFTKLRSWPYAGPCGLVGGLLPEIAVTGHETLCMSAKLRSNVP